MKKRTSVKTLIIFPLIIQTLFIVLVITYISYERGRDNVSILIRELEEQISGAVYNELNDLMSIPALMNNADYNAIVNRMLDLSNREIRDRYFASQLKIFKEPDDTFIGLNTGEFYGARRNEKGEIEVILNNKETSGNSAYYSTDEHGNAKDFVLEIKNFDCRTRPWYKAGMTYKTETYSEIYRHFVLKDLTVTAQKPIFEKNGTLRGVLGVDITLGRLNKYLQEMKVGKTGIVYIFESETGKIVANSVMEKNYIEKENKEIYRYSPDELKNKMVNLSYKKIKGNPVFSKNDRNYYEIKTDNKLDFVLTKQFEILNLKWTIAIVVPEEDFYEEINKEVRNNIIITLIILFLTTLLVLYIINWLLKPLYRVIEATKRLEMGDLSVRADIGIDNEIGGLAKSFNSMADKLEVFVENLEDKIQERTELLEKKNAELIKVNATKDKFISIIGHDLRGPAGSMAMLLNEVYNNIEAMDREELEEIIKSVKDSSREVYNLIENLFLWARTQKGDIDFDPVDINVTDIIMKNLSLFKTTAENKKITIEYVRDEDVEVCCDKNMLQTIIRNIIGNAVKFTSKGGKILIYTYYRQDKETIIEIKDSGIGMNEEQIRSILEKNEHKTTVGTGGEAGTGLGLILCKEFLQKNSGKMEIESIQGEGTLFRIIIPRKCNIY